MVIYFHTFSQIISHKIKISKIGRLSIFEGFRTLRIFLDQNPNLATLKGVRGVCISLMRSNLSLTILNLVNSNQILIVVVTLFRLTWHQTKFLWVSKYSERCNYLQCKFGLIQHIKSNFYCNGINEYFYKALFFFTRQKHIAVRETGFFRQLYVPN